MLKKLAKLTALFVVYVGLAIGSVGVLQAEYDAGRGYVIFNPLADLPKVVCK